MNIGEISIPVEDLVNQLPSLALELWKYMISGSGGLALRIIGWAIPIVMGLFTLWFMWRLFSLFNNTWDKSESWVKRKLR
ncbi:MAG: hypothetical protein GOV00_00455 [Candidatus Altiarchaeota archaeon]|nr:hypothetical protein [Candidatus Altiarchaeota archaeon]